MADPFVKAYEEINKPGWSKRITPKVLAYLKEEEEKRKQKIQSAFILIGSILLCGIIILFCAVTARAEEIDINRLADSIYLAEGGSHTRHPYGILKKYKTTTPRQACINTIKSALRRYEKSDKSVEFISFLGKTYCPTTGNHLTSDEKKLNVFWVKNVSYFYYR